MAFAYAERHDNIETIYKKLEERRDTADVSELLKELHRIVNEAIRAAAPCEDQKESKLFEKYLKTLEDQEKEMEDLQTKLKTLHADEAMARKAYDEFLANLSAE